MNSPAKECPRFDTCSVNNCPLDDRYPEIPTHPGDKEKSCPMEKGVRSRISKRFPGVLKMDGLTTREYAARKRYDSLSLAVKTEMAEMGRRRLELHRKDKHGKIEP